MKTVSTEIMRYSKIKKPKKGLFEELSNDDIQVFMNTWANYNEYGADSGITSTGWMSPEEALEYCKKYAEYEPFINDIENSPIEVSEYDNAPSKLQELVKINNYEDKKLLKNALETGYTDNVDEMIKKLDDGDYIWFEGVNTDAELGEAYINMIGSIKDALGDRAGNYIDESRLRDDLRDDVINIIYDDGEYEDIDDIPEEEIESYTDSIINDELLDDKTVENYFDYEAFGRDLGFDGFTFTTDGCIEIY